MEVDEQSSDEEEEEVQNVVRERDWDNNCFVCKKGGDLMCCEHCTHVAHQRCVGLKKEPSEWNCEDCLVRMT
jgi:hypothetical protein